MKIALDAMGGDHAPEEIIKGAEEALNLYSFIKKIFLVGQEDKVSKYLKNIDKKRVEIVNANEVINMEDHPGLAFRKKKDASITIAAKLVKNKEADALVSAGSTGAQLVASLLGIGRIKGVDRPAIGTVLPTLGGGKLLLDAGANTNCKVNNLVQFALLGSIYTEYILGIPKPKVALVNVGSEKTKGSDLVQSAYESLEKINSINFVGNIEGRDIPKGIVDVMVCDGFVGNVILKMAEGMGSALSDLLKQEIKKSLSAKMGAGLMLPALKGMKSRMDYSEYGGAPLLGINGISIICHGSSKAKAIHNAIRIAHECYEKNVIDIMKSNLQMGEV